MVIRRLQSKHLRSIWDDKSWAIVIRDPNSKDGGTAFRPTLGKTCFDKQNKIIMNIINYIGDDIIISLTIEELQLLRSLVIEIYAGVYRFRRILDCVRICNSKLVQD